MARELPKVYEPQQVESKIYDMWQRGGYFHAEVDESKKPFTIVMPPPNVTGQLHMGHAMDATLQDTLIRFKRMQGYNALWIPGVDHAGIATQIKVEEELRKEGLTRYDLGREKFLERVWDWKHKYGNRIVEQQKKLGASCDWERARFTMDEGCSKAVREVFVSLYEKGLIYKGSRIINWCPHCVTALSDAEVEYVDKPGHLWHIRYPLADGSGEVIVATTRPETMLGDSGVCVNPNDERYKDIVGKMVILPLVNKEIPVVADDYAEMDFGTGCVKMTPAHDPNDFEVGLRHNLEVIRVLDDNGKVNENGGKYEGLDRYEARKQIVADLEAGGYLVKVEPYSHNVGTCYRCHQDVEPIISAQWFVKMKPLAEEAIRVVKDGETKFVPERFSKTYLNWMENVRDWCISRQLWWGHQIPAWTCADCGHITVSREDVCKCEKCGSTNVERDPDVLDTWFSSALWPFETLGWPEKTEDLDYFYPMDVLVTGYDIIFFWVARMIFSGCEHTGNAQIKVRILGRKCVELRFFALRDHTALVFKNEVRAADDDLFALHSAGNAVRDDVFHARMVLFVGEAAVLGFGHDSVCHGVRVMLLKAGGKAQHFAFLTVAERFDHGDTRCCVCQRAGFIEHNGIGVCNGLHEAAALDGNMVCAALAHGGQHRDRHGEL